MEKRKPSYQNDMAHCGQDACKLKDICYRFFLGQEIKNTEYSIASFVRPAKIGNDCRYFLNKDNY
jgi:hypothetical protein